MKHSHPGTGLVVGCDACIWRVRVDQWNATVADLDTEDLIEIALAPADWRSMLADEELERRWNKGSVA